MIPDDPFQLEPATLRGNLAPVKGQELAAAPRRIAEGRMTINYLCV
jgi:hypothetical protein